MQTASIIKRRKDLATRVTRQRRCRNTQFPRKFQRRRRHRRRRRLADIRHPAATMRMCGVHFTHKTGSGGSQLYLVALDMSHTSDTVMNARLDLSSAFDLDGTRVSETNTRRLQFKPTWRRFGCNLRPSKTKTETTMFALATSNTTNKLVVDFL